MINDPKKDELLAGVVLAFGFFGPFLVAGAIWNESAFSKIVACLAGPSLMAAAWGFYGWCIFRLEQKNEENQ